MRLKLMCLPAVLSRNCPSEGVLYRSLPLPRGRAKGLGNPRVLAPFAQRAKRALSDVLPSLGQRLATTREEVPMMASEPVKMFACAALAQARIEAGVPKVLIPCEMAASHSSRVMQRPITRSCMVVVVVKSIVRRTRHVMRVRICTGALFSPAYRQAVLWHLDSCFAPLPTLVSPSMPG